MDNSENETKRKPGRPRIQIDEKLLLSLAQIHCTMKEMSAILDISVDTLSDNYSDIIEKGREEGKMSIRRAQFKRALEGNVGMLVWLGKNLLNQSDKIEQRNVGEAFTQISVDEIKEIIKQDQFIDLMPDPISGTFVKEGYDKKTKALHPEKESDQ